MSYGPLARGTAIGSPPTRKGGGRGGKEGGGEGGGEDGARIECVGGGGGGGGGRRQGEGGGGGEGWGEGGGHGVVRKPTGRLNRGPRCRSSGRAHASRLCHPRGSRARVDHPGGGRGLGRAVAGCHAAVDGSRAARHRALHEPRDLRGRGRAPAADPGLCRGPVRRGDAGRSSPSSTTRSRARSCDRGRSCTSSPAIPCSAATSSPTPRKTSRRSSSAR